MPILTTVEKADYDTVVTDALRKSDVIDNLTSQEVQKPLSAKQGYLLNQDKLGPSSIVNNLHSTGSTKVLSAKQGKVLNDKISGLIGALVFKGTLDASGAASQLANAKVGWLWVVSVAGTLLGKALKVGEEVYCKTAVTGTPTNFNNFESVPTQDGTLHTSDVINNLTSTVADKPLSAAQGKILQDNKASLSIVSGIVKQRKAILDVGSFTGSGTKSDTFSFQTVFGENFGTDASKIHIQLTVFTNGNYNDMMMLSVRTVSSTEFIVNTRRVDVAGSSWGTPLKAFCTISQLT